MQEIKNLDSISKDEQDILKRFLMEHNPDAFNLNQFLRNRNYSVTFSKEENCYYVYKLK